MLGGFELPGGVVLLPLVGAVVDLPHPHISAVRQIAAQTRTRVRMSAADEHFRAHLEATEIRFVNEYHAADDCKKQPEQSAHHIPLGHLAAPG